MLTRFHAILLRLFDEAVLDFLDDDALALFDEAALCFLVLRLTEVVELRGRDCNALRVLLPDCCFLPTSVLRCFLTRDMLDGGLTWFLALLAFVEAGVLSWLSCERREGDIHSRFGVNFCPL